MSIARKRVAKHIPAEANARRSIARQRRGKQALSRIHSVFSVGSVQSGYKGVEFRIWQFSSKVLEEREWELEEYKRVEWSTTENENENGACPSDWWSGYISDSAISDCD
jgi:hypothetical protein